MDQSSSLLKSYDAGIRPFLRKSSSNFRSTLKKLMCPIDIKELSNRPDMPQIVPTLSSRDLYLAVKQNGVLESLEVLSHLSTEQWVRFCDYDTWHKDRLAPKEVLRWVSVYKHLSPEKMYERFRALDEEYQIATLSTYIRVYDSSEYESFDADRQDRLYRFPGEELFYEVISEDEEIQSGIEDLISIAMGEDMAYAMSVISHAGYAVPLESEHLLAQFRKARLEEDGFVAEDEAKEAFYPLKAYEILGLQNRCSMLIQSGLVPSQETSDELFFTKVLQQVKGSLSLKEQQRWMQSVMHLANCLAAAIDLETDDLSGLELLLEHCTGLLSIALEDLSQKDPLAACWIIQREHPKTLFRYGMTLIRSKQGELLHKMEATSPVSLEKLRSYWSLQKFSMIQDWFDKHVTSFGYEQIEVLKAFFNRFPMVADIQQGYSSNKLFFRPVQSQDDLYLPLI